MLDYRGLRPYWIEARKRRGLSIANLARKMSSSVGYEVNRDQLSNFEYKETKPSIELWEAIVRQVRTWQLEDELARGAVRMDRTSYAADHICETCTLRVPGPIAGARYCLYCGTFYSFKICASCKAVEERLDAEFCVRCGSRLNDSEALT